MRESLSSTYFKIKDKPTGEQETTPEDRQRMEEEPKGLNHNPHSINNETLSPLASAHSCLSLIRCKM